MKVLAFNGSPKVSGNTFHALKMVQCLAERRAGGETGIASVQCITGPAVWTTGLFDRTLRASLVQAAEPAA